MKKALLFVLVSLSYAAFAGDMKVTIFRYWAPIYDIKSKLIRLDEQDPTICTELSNRLKEMKHQETSHETFATELTIKGEAVFDEAGKEVGNYIEKENRIRTSEETLFPTSYRGVPYKQHSFFYNNLSKSGDGIETQEETISIHTGDGSKLLCTFVVRRMCLVKTPYER